MLGVVRIDEERGASLFLLKMCFLSPSDSGDLLKNAVRIWPSLSAVVVRRLRLKAVFTRGNCFSIKPQAHECTEPEEKVPTKFPEEP